MLHTDVIDLANFMITILQDGVFHNNTLLSTSNLNNMFTPQVANIEPTQGLQFYKETFNVSSGSILLWGHSGQEYGISTEMYFDHANDMGIAVLANGENDATQILEKLYDYGISLSPSGIGNPVCNPADIVDKAKSLFSYCVYPNPANNSVSFRADNLYNIPHEIIISDLTGRSLISLVKNESEINVNVSNLSNGIYIYTINENDNTIKTGKLIIIK